MTTAIASPSASTAASASETKDFLPAAITCWRDAEQMLGLEVVKSTMDGPAAFRRVYCRVTDAGKELLEQYFGVQGLGIYPDTSLTRNGASVIGYVFLDAQSVWPLVAFYAGIKRIPGYVLHQSKGGTTITLVQDKEHLTKYAQLWGNNSSAEVYRLIPGTCRYEHIG